MGDTEVGGAENLGFLNLARLVAISAAADRNTMFPADLLVCMKYSGSRGSPDFPKVGIGLATRPFEK